MRHHHLLLTALAAAAVGLVLVASAAAQDSRAARGKYLATIMDCHGCHTTGAFTGKPDPAKHLAGELVGFAIPGLGTFYPPNLTPDRETGIGGWSEAQIVTALRTGVRPDGRQLAPIMPWPSYAALTDTDARALAAYLKSISAVRQSVPGPFGPNETPSHPFLAVTAPK
ncbi:MAG: cytochrome c [Alphaproteobacteria bacterium]